MPLQVQVQLSGYVVASVWGGASANYSYPLYYDVGAPVQDHFLNFKVHCSSPCNQACCMLLPPVTLWWSHLSALPNDNWP